MAPRLSVVVSYGGGAQGLSSDFAAELVARLMFEPDCNVSLIGPLDQLMERETERILLEGIPTDFALVSGWAPAEALARLQACGILHAKSGGGLSSPPYLAGRRVFPMQVSGTATLETALDPVKKLLKSRQTAVVTIGGLQPQRPTAVAQPTKLDAAPLLPRVSAPHQPSDQNSHLPQVAVPSGASAAPAPSSAPSQTAAWLDSLVDQLDELDL